MSAPECQAGGLRLSRRLAELAGGNGGALPTLGSLLDALKERGHALLAFVLVVPFLQPVPLPGVSTVFGLAIAMVGLQLARGRPPWLPRRLRQHPLPQHALARLCAAGQRFFRRFERVIRPRAAFLHASVPMQRLTGLVLLAAGLLLALPLPIPVSNFLPALTIALVTLGLLEEDGLVVGLGYGAFFGTLVFFALLVGLPLLGLAEARAFPGR